MTKNNNYRNYIVINKEFFIFFILSKIKIIKKIRNCYTFIILYKKLNIIYYKYFQMVLKWLAGRLQI